MNATDSSACVFWGVLVLAIDPWCVNLHSDQHTCTTGSTAHSPVKCPFAAFTGVLVSAERLVGLSVANLLVLGFFLVTQQQAAWEKHQLIGMRCMHMHSQTKKKHNKQTNRDRPTKQATQNSTRRRRPRRQPVRSLPSPALQSSSCRQASTSDICNIHTFSCHASHQHINRCTFSVRGTCEPQRSPGNLTEGAEIAGY